jgi:D-alanyl-lipoteichoic acid acyltransferase DltB (MBOAT superfamily)
VLFNSLEFLIFFPVVYTLYRVLPFRGQNYMLLGASYIFYGWWDWRFLFLAAFSTTIDYWVGLTMQNRLGTREKIVPALFITGAAILFLGMHPDAIGSAIVGDPHPGIIKAILPWVVLGILGVLAIAASWYRMVSRLPEHRRRKAALLTSVVCQLSLLGVFKYFNFFEETFISGLAAVGIHTDPVLISVILPVGISFYTFQSLSYAIDIYRGEFEPTDRFFDFALFVAYFPQMVSGPIERARHLLPEFQNRRVITLEQSARGLYLIMLGMFKKVAIADGVAPSVNQVYASTGLVTSADVIAGTLLFAVQIYCDFSGYTDIARGVSKLFGIDLMLNFNLPYFAKNPRDFWRRWHISLSTWLSDYLYKTLGGNRGSLAFTCRNLMITMVLGGLWHGAAWNYVLWGFYHGTLLSVHRVWTDLRGRSMIVERGPAPLGAAAALPRRNLLIGTAKIGFFFLFTLYGWLLFRVTSLHQVVDFTRLAFSASGILDFGAALPRLSALAGMPVLAAMEFAEYNMDDRYWYRRLPLPLFGLLSATLLFLTLMGTSNEPAQFIYFQF